MLCSFFSLSHCTCVVYLLLWLRTAIISESENGQVRNIDWIKISLEYLYSKFIVYERWIIVDAWEYSLANQFLGCSINFQTSLYRVEYWMNVSLFLQIVYDITHLTLLALLSSSLGTRLIRETHQRYVFLINSRTISRQAWKLDRFHNNKVP